MVNKDDKSIVKINQTTFADESLQERYDIQEWINKNPECLGEELLIIQKEFNGFDKTNERLDLLAIDTKGNLVVIENKRDDSGKDVTWQSIKYAAYCSTLTTEQVVELYSSYLQTNHVAGDAITNLQAFLGSQYEDLLSTNTKPRIILVAKEYRPEVTASALWLRSCGIDIRCIKTTLYKTDDTLLFDALQIIPVKEAEEYMVKVSEKAHENEQTKERHNTRLAFWSTVCDQLQSKHDIDITPSDRIYVGKGIGYTGVHLALVATSKYVRVELYLSGQHAKERFDLLEQHAAELSEAFGTTLTFERLDDKQASRIKLEKADLSIYDHNDYPEIREFFDTYTPPIFYKVAPKVIEILEKN